MAEGRSYGHGDDLANVDYVKRHHLPTSNFRCKRGAPFANGRLVN